MNAREPGKDFFEPFPERQVREAMARGEFDNLAGAGRPLPAQWYANHAPDWWLHRKLADENLPLSAVLPPSVQVRQQKAQIQQLLAEISREDQARELIEDLNARIVEVNLAQRGQHAVLTKKLPVEETLAEWRRQRRA